MPGKTLHSPRITRLTLVATASVAAAIALGACAHYRDPQINTLGVLPPQPPPPLWLGALQSRTDTTLRGAVAVTPSATPDWSHILLSVRGARPGVAYVWHLRSGACDSGSSPIGPPNRFVPVVAGSDGTGATETSVPLELSSGQTYSVSVRGNGATSDTACATLAYTRM